MFEYMRTLFDGVLQNVIAGLVGALLGALFTHWLQWQQWRAWERKEFENRVHFSITSLDEYAGADRHHVLVIDSFGENSLNDVVDDPTAQALVMEAIKRTTPEVPFLLFNGNDQRDVLAYFQTAIASLYTHGTFRKLIPSANVRTEECVFAVTYERYPGMLRQKIRVLLVNVKTLQHAQTVEDVRFEHRHQLCRLQTLRDMAEDWFGQRRFTMRIRINYPA